MEDVTMRIDCSGLDRARASIRIGSGPDKGKVRVVVTTDGKEWLLDGQDVATILAGSPHGIEVLTALMRMKKLVEALVRPHPNDTAQESETKAMTMMHAATLTSGIVGDLLQEAGDFCRAYVKEYDNGDGATKRP